VLDFRTNIINDYPACAVFSQDRKYRYILSRDWSYGDNVVTWIMLNPSTGDEETLERTTAGCLKRSQMWGYSGMVILNLFALITSDPNKLKSSRNAIGDFNDAFILGTLARLDEGSTIIAAWGNHGKHLDRDREVSNLLIDRDIFCLGTNKDGSPRHPLHMSHSVKPQLWRAKE
jgi:hypothetical protein